MFVVCVVCNEKSFEKRLFDREKLDDKMYNVKCMESEKKSIRNTHKYKHTSYIHLILDVPTVVDIHLCIGRANIFME